MKRIPVKILSYFIPFLLSLTLPTVMDAQESEAPPPMLNSPYGAIRTHLYYLQHETYHPEIAAEVIPPSIPKENAVQLAIQIKQVFDGKGLFIRLNKVPREADFIDTIAKAHIYTPFPKDLPDVYLERTDTSWYYSLHTLKAIPQLHRKLYPFGADLLSRRMPDWLRGRFLGITMWQYIGLACLILLCWLMHLVLWRIFRPVVKWLSERFQNLGYANPREIRKAAQYLSFLLVIFLAGKTFPVFQLPIRWSQVVNTGISIVSAIFWMLLGLVVVGIMTKRIRVYARATDSKMDDQLLPILRKVLQITVVLIAVVYILSKLNVNVTALIAGLSIGALALALAAQDTVKNLIGSIMIFIDKPFQVGDFVRLDDREGTIVEVGFRSTRVQMIDTSIVSIPNGNVANMTITNLGARHFRLMNTQIGLTYDTPPEKIELFIAELKNLILSHPGVHKENWLVYFQEMGDFSLKILFRCYIPVPSYSDELKTKEELYLEIMRIAQRIGVEFAFPTQTIYMAGDKEAP